ncbi:MAG: gcvP [Cytophagaceae bacterium]|jgi:glycine dehydrogenase|nr:gcvP [Cytophagaceae bacterium]
MIKSNPEFEGFQSRHIGPSKEEQVEMLNSLSLTSLDQLIEQTVPNGIRIGDMQGLPAALTEQDFITHFKEVASWNKVTKSYIGLGYYGTVTPPVILRNILENPGWYTAYTPYQAEIAQGRLEALINYQTTVSDLTGMQITNASLLDEGTAAAEAMTFLHALRKADKKNAEVFLVSETCFPQTIDVLKSRAVPLGIELRIKKITASDLESADVFGLIVQTPDTDGIYSDYSALFQLADAKGIYKAVATDLMACVLFKPAGEMGADVVVGTSQRFGVPMGFGGPHAAFFATKDEYKRSMPGRIIGVSIDASGKKAYRMALQTREQHIRREKATSNICTSQVLLAVMAGSYAVYHGPQGLKRIATRIKKYTDLLSTALSDAGYVVNPGVVFDTVVVSIGNKTAVLREKAEQAGINFRYYADKVFISLDETTTRTDLDAITELFSQACGKGISISWVEKINGDLDIPAALQRESAYLQHPVFNSYHSEHNMLRYLKHLENKDLSLAHSMISLGSCTMKLNATTEMIPVTWPEFASIHPFVPSNQVGGYIHMTNELSKWLCGVTGFAGVSLQPNSGAQGEYAGLLVIRAYHEDRGEVHRNVALIPTSAHGTNPASAVMAGFKVVLVACDDMGNIDVADLKEKAAAHAADLSCLMVTYPSTHGVFEESIKDICATIHQYGGQVYMDGANMNAQVGLTSPAAIGADVCHLNLHKTFCIPHGGGGPGVGPIGVGPHLVQYLPSHVLAEHKSPKAISAVSAALFGSAAILPIPYAYIAMMGANGLKRATEVAILNANYLKSLLEKEYKVLYSGSHGRCAHEFILDCRSFKLSAGVEVEDIAKRLMDYGFHAPTVSFPVAGTLMIEPTESESKSELDRFAEAMISIRQEIREIEEGKADKAINVLKMAPHTSEILLSDKWDRPYGREKAAYPLEWVRQAKFWPSVSRIDSAYGDRNLFCSCIPVEEYNEPVNA